MSETPTPDQQPLPIELVGLLPEVARQAFLLDTITSTGRSGFGGDVDQDLARLHFEDSIVELIREATGKTTRQELEDDRLLLETAMEAQGGATKVIEAAMARGEWLPDDQSTASSPEAKADSSTQSRLQRAVTKRGIGRTLFKRGK